MEPQMNADRHRWEKYGNLNLRFTSRRSATFLSQAYGIGSFPADPGRKETGGVGGPGREQRQRQDSFLAPGCALSSPDRPGTRRDSVSRPRRIGGDVIAKAPADGHTLGVIVSAHAIATALFAKNPFDAARDYAPVTQGISVANAISVHPSVPATSIADLVKMARAHPGKLSFGSAGAGTGVRLTGEFFKMVARVDITHVPYKGGGPSLADLVAGQVPVGVQNVSTIMAHVKAGRVRPLGITSLERSPALPELPTVAEQGYPGFEATEWYGVVTPAGTPRAVVTRLNREFVRILNLPDVRGRLLDLGTVVVGSTPEEFCAFMKTELTKWSKVLKETGIRLE
jgi:tripartite-type tricarboxylate transporter receptor subunit TctC